MPVDIWLSAKMDEIAEGRRTKKIIEDACQAHGASYKERSAARSAMSVTFLSIPKNMTVGATAA